MIAPNKLSLSRLIAPRGYKKYKKERKMKKLLSLILILAFAISITGCSNARHGVNEYSYMYEVTSDWNERHGENAESLFGYGERLYNSHLVLFPRTAPESLTDFYFDWQVGGRIDKFAVYFTCELTPTKYNRFVTELEEFEVVLEGGISLPPIHNTKSFSKEAYILQWMNRGADGEVYEFILLDSVERTVVFVYTVGLFAELDKICPYDLAPVGNPLIDVIPEDGEEYIGFSIYSGFETAHYDNSLLDLLN